MISMAYLFEEFVSVDKIKEGMKTTPKTFTDRLREQKINREQNPQRAQAQRQAMSMRPV